MRFPKIFALVLCGFLTAGVVRAEEPFDLHQNTAQNRWLEASPQKRLAIVQEWQELPATTRQPFPVFRDRIMGETCASHRMKKETALK